jgi:hypothetical protein
MLECTRKINFATFISVQVTLTLADGSNSGTEDLLGTVFHLNTPIPTGLSIVKVTRGLTALTAVGQTLSNADIFRKVRVDGISDEDKLCTGGCDDPGFTIEGKKDGSGGVAVSEPYDAGESWQCIHSVT